MPSLNKSIRLRIKFDNPPPGMPTSSKYMILVKPSLSKTIFDLEQLVVRKFGFAKGSTASLSLDEFVLVSTEEVGILNNDDCISVTVIPDTRRSSVKKRKLDTNGSTPVNKKLKCQPHTKKTMKTTKKLVSMNATNSPKFKRKPATSSSDPSDSSSSDAPQKSIIVSNHKNGIGPSKKLLKSKNVTSCSIRKVEPQSKKCKTERLLLSKSKKSATESSSSDDEKEQVVMAKSHVKDAPIEACKSNTIKTSTSKPNSSISIKKTSIGKSQKQNKAPSANGGHITFDSSSSSDSEMETEVVSIPEKQIPLKDNLKSWLGTANDSPECTFTKNSTLTELKDPGISTNISFVIENPSESQQNKEMPETVEVQKPPTRDFTNMLNSTWPPRVGDIIAYKLLEMAQDYTPVISDYKECKVLDIFSANNSPIGVNAIKIEYLWPNNNATNREGGRFEMDLSDSEINECNEHVIEWQSLLDPKRIE